MDDSDLSAIERIKAGDTDAFRYLVDRHSRAVFRVAYRLTGNESDAEDVVQETFLKAYRQIGRFESRSAIGTWLHRIAVNCALDLLRQRRSQAATFTTTPGDDEERPLELADDASPEPDRLLYSAELQAKVAEAMEGLTPSERAAFVLRHFEGRSIEEIGGVLGLRTSATKHSVFRAVQKLRRALEPLLA